MFNNLIESSSHAKEFKRRGSFLLLTTGTYLVLFVIAGVASIYAYDAHLETQNTQLEVTFVPVLPTEEAPPEVVRNTIRSASNPESAPTRSTRTVLMDDASNPTNVPDKIGTVASSVPPARPDSVLGLTNADPPTPVGSTRGVPGGTGTTPVVNIPDTPPLPPAPEPKREIKVLNVSKGVLEGKAISLPRPAYSEMAKRTRIQGPVTVQVLIDETGKVVSATVVSGHPLLAVEAKRAAMQARFSPTKLGDQAVKVSGVITYNFVLGQ